MDEGYALETMTPEQRRELLEKTIEKSFKNCTWPMLLAVIGMIFSMDNKEN